MDWMEQEQERGINYFSRNYLVIGLPQEQCKPKGAQECRINIIEYPESLTLQ